VAGAGLWTATHGVAGVAWRDVASVLGAVPVSRLGLLGVIWLAGLAIYAFVLSAALPGLGLRRSLLLNLSGSAVANVVPLGGAVATALNWRMVRGWGHSTSAFTTYCVVTNGLDVLTKLLLPPVAVTTFVVLSVHVPRPLWVVAASCAAAVLVILAVERLLVLPLPDRAAAGRAAAWRRRVHELGARIRSLVTRGWTRMLPASVGYIAAQVALLSCSLRSVGLHVPLSVVLMAAAIERLGTLVPLTPGGTGVAEIGTIAWLVANGLDPVAVVAGVLLYRVFLVGMEIPLGGALLGAWAWCGRLRPGSPREAAA
jgi:uncharacterized membrane protein YbhN (UPF0104 family)